MKVFDSIEQRIRARCKQYLHSQRAEDDADEEKAAMFQVAQARPTQPPPQPQQAQQPQQPQNRGNERRKRSHSNDRCFFCCLMGHRMNECLDYRHLQALQRKQRQEQRRQMHSGIMPHGHQMQGSQLGDSPSPYEPLQLTPMANAVGYQQSQAGVSPGSHAQQSMIFPSQLSAIGSVYGMPSPSMQQIPTEVQNLRDQVAMLQQELQALQGPTGLTGGGQTRMY
jgi:hypothetical protein